MNAKTDSSVTFRVQRETKPGSGRYGVSYVCTCDFETTAKRLAWLVAHDMWIGYRVYVFQSGKLIPVYSAMAGEGTAPPAKAAKKGKR